MWHRHSDFRRRLFSGSKRTTSSIDFYYIWTPFCLCVGVFIGAYFGERSDNSWWQAAIAASLGFICATIFWAIAHRAIHNHHRGRDDQSSTRAGWTKFQSTTPNQTNTTDNHDHNSEPNLKLIYNSGPNNTVFDWAKHDW